MLKLMALAVCGAGLALLVGESLLKASAFGEVSAKPPASSSAGALSVASASSTAVSSSSSVESPSVSTVRVKVVYFQMPQYVDVQQEYFVLQAPANLGDLLGDITDKHPSLSSVMPTMMILVDGVSSLASASPGTSLKDGDEVDFIPLMAGG